MNVALVGRSFWCTIGGGIEAGETPEEGAARELWEETGLSSQDVRWKGPIWVARTRVERDGRMLEQHETYFLAYANTDRFDLSNLDVEEAAVVRQMRWWTLAELSNTTETVFPLRLATLLEPVVRGDAPTKVIEIE